MGFYSNASTVAAQSVFALSSQTASFTAAANTLYQVSASSAAVTVTLPTSTASQSILVKKTDTSTNAVTLSGTINGTASTTYAITKQNQSKQLYADGSGGWIIIDGDVDLTTVTSTSTVTGLLNAVGASKMTIGTTAPSSPATGDLWVDTN